MNPEVLEVHALNRTLAMKVHGAELLSNILRSRRRYSHYDLQILERLLQPGSTFLDIGANIGWYSLVAAQLLGENGRILAFEPEPTNARLLRENLTLNRAPRFSVIEKAVSDEIGSAQLYLSRDNFGDHALTRAGQKLADRDAIPVATTTLDNVLNDDEFKAVSLIKVDVQGAEARVLKGMKRLLETHRPPLLLEYSPFHMYECGSSPFEIFVFLDQSQYVPFLVNDEGGDTWEKLLSPLDVEGFFRLTKELRDHPMGVDILFMPKTDYFDRATKLFFEHRFEEAEREYAKIQPSFPDYWHARVNIGLTQEPQGRWTEAVREMRAAEENCADTRIKSFARYKLGWHVIREGDFKTGMQWLRLGRDARAWGAYSSRFINPRLEPHHNLHGRTVLVVGEAGQGDEIVNVRFCRTLQERGARVIYQNCHEGLAPLIQRIGGFDYFAGNHETRCPPYDYWVAGIDLPAALGLDLQELRPEPYLQPHPEFVARWAEKLALKNSRPRVGLRWSGAPDVDRQQLRALPLPKIEELVAQFPEFDFYSFQTEEGPTPKGVTPLDLPSWEDTAAALSRMDLLVSSCTGVVHVAAAQGRKVFLIVPVVPYYMWAPSQNRSPWYSDLTLFRQKRAREWDEPFEDVIRALQEFRASFSLNS